MPVTFKEFREIVAPFAGRAGKDPASIDVARFARTVMEQLLYSGSHAGVRRLDILAYNGIITFPPEVEIPITVRINNRFSSVWNKWFSFHEVDEDFFKASASIKCLPAAQIIIEDGSTSPLAYGLPHGGAPIGVVANCDEANGSTIDICGYDPSGVEIYSNYRGENIPGIRLTLEKNKIHYSDIEFGVVTSAVKSRTNGYVSCYAINPATKQQSQFLANWSPSEEKPLYRKFKVIDRGCAPIAHVSILCRVRLKDNYHDNELTLFDNFLAIQLAAQRGQAETNNDIQVANYKNQAVTNLLDNEAGYKKISGNPISVFKPLSGGSIKNIV